MRVTSKDSSMLISGRMPGRARAVMFFLRREHQPSTCYAQKTIAFHLEFNSKIIENARYKMQSLYSMVNLEIANKGLSRKQI
jgi:hypothetical protein